MYYEGNKRTFVAGENLAARRRVKISSGTVVYADADENSIGVTEFAVSSGEQVTVRLMNAGGTFEVTAAGAISLGADCSGAADGKVATGAEANTAEGDEGVALEAATADGDIIEVIFKVGKLTTGA